MAAPHTKSRATKRVAALLPVTVEVNGTSAVGVTIDLSAGGVGLELNKLPRAGDVVSLRVNMPGGLVIETTAEVMHAGVAKRDRCGLRFKGLDQRALTAIHELVSRLSP
jgi:hypothetical protein